jgi:integrase
VIRIALNEAMRQDLVHRNVAALVKAPSVSGFEGTALDAGEAMRFLEQVKTDRLDALYGVAIALGLRQSEAFGLRWHDIDIDVGTLTVRHQLRMVQGKPTWVESKSRRSRRTIPLPAPLLAMLRRHRTRQKEERLMAGARWNDYELVFCTPIGTPLDDSNVRKQFAGHLEAAGLPRIRYHDLRHSAASLLPARGVDQRTVMEILWHSRIATTVNVYTHIASASMRDATDRLSDLFGSDKASS